MRRIFIVVLLSLSCGSDTTRFAADQSGTSELTPDRPGGRDASVAGAGGAPTAGVAPDAGSPAAGSPVAGSPVAGGSGQGAIRIELGDAGPADAGPVRDCARFLPIPLPAGFNDSTVTHLSGDGLLVAANGAASVAYAHRWQQSNSMIVLSPLDGDARTWVTGVNRDGSVIVGGSSGPSGSRAVSWDGNGTPAPIGELSDAIAVSADGSIVLGQDANGFVRWTASGTERITALSAVNGMSADGRSLVGIPIVDAAVADRAALDSGEGLVLLGLPGELSSRATLISDDAQVVVGTSIGSDAVVRVFRWQAGTSVLLDGMSDAYGVNADGSVILGGASADECGSSAGVWRQGSGLKTLGCLLPAPIVPEQWQLGRVTSVSDDGRVVSGSGINPDQVLQGWVAVLGDVCPAP